MTMNMEAFESSLAAIREKCAKSRTDIWIAFADGIYRFWLPYSAAQELEAKLGRVDRDGVRTPKGIMAIYGSVARGRYEMDGKPVGFEVEAAATLDECRETVRLALIGGNTAVIDGKMTSVNATVASRLVQNYVDGAPETEAWNLAYAILYAAIEGRQATKHELETEPRTRTAISPIELNEEPVDG